MVEWLRRISFIEDRSTYGQLEKMLLPIAIEDISVVKFDSRGEGMGWQKGRQEGRIGPARVNE